MAASLAALGYGSIFSTGVAGETITYTPVVEISTINFAGFSVPDVETTHLLSPDATEESIPGLLKPGTVELSGNYTGVASQQSLTTLGQARTVFPFKIASTLGDGSAYTVTGTCYVAKLQKGPFDAKKKIDFAATLQVTGTITESVVAPG